MPQYLRSKKAKREQATNIVINRLDALLLPQDQDTQQLLLHTNALKRALKSKVRFQSPIYDDSRVFYREFEKDLSAFIRGLEKNQTNDISAMKEELFSLMESFFKWGPIGSFFNDFPLIVTIITATIPGLLISIINLFIKK